METKYELLDGVQQEMGSRPNSAKFDKTESFVVDLESVSSNDISNELNNTFDYTTTTSNYNSTIITRSLSNKKVSPHDNGRKFNYRDLTASSSSPTAQKSVSPSTRTSTTYEENNQIPQHQITIKTASINTIPEGRRLSLRRPPPSWFNSPKRILLFFASLSSMGTMLLIFLTLFVSRR